MIKKQNCFVLQNNTFKEEKNHYRIKCGTFIGNIGLSRKDLPHKGALPSQHCLAQVVVEYQEDFLSQWAKEMLEEKIKPKASFLHISS